jgi:hypothetical protein
VEVFYYFLFEYGSSYIVKIYNDFQTYFLSFLASLRSKRVLLQNCQKALAQYFVPKYKQESVRHFSARGYYLICNLVVTNKAIKILRHLVTKPSAIFSTIIDIIT